MPLPDFEASLGCLDNRRLGKQRVEARQILNALRSGGGWARHPAVLMWRDREPALMLYGNLAIIEWVRRGFHNTMPLLADAFIPRKLILPFWMGWPAFHASHRSNLLRKDEPYYRQHGWTEPTDLSYIWPQVVASIPEGAPNGFAVRP